MNTLFQRILLLARRHSTLLLYLTAAIGGLSLLNLAVWPTPDEYFYGSLARAMQAAAMGLLPWSDINTEHVGTVAWLSYQYNNLFTPESLLASRVVIFRLRLWLLLRCI